jgi:tetratricopeptide (TPR) repeat protein
VSNASLGKLYLYSGRIDDAIKRLHEATGQLPSLSRPWTNLGQCYELAGNTTEVKSSYERAAFLDPVDYSTWARLADLAYREQQPAAAIDYYKRAIAGWSNQSSIHAGRVLRIYLSKIIVPNDIVPRNLLAYSKPSFDSSAVCSRLAEMYRASGNPAAARYFDNLREELERRK